MIGQEGCIDWSLGSFLTTWKNAIMKREFTPELTSLFQSITNEMMPGFSFDIGTFHWFLRPHAQNTKIGFALFGSRSFNPLASDATSLKNLQFLSQNIGELAPLSSFVFRRVSHTLEIGEVLADIFIMVSSTSTIFVQVCIKFIFNHDKLSANVIDGMSKTLSGVKSSNSLQSQDTNVSKTNVSNGNAPAEEASNESKSLRMILAQSALDAYVLLSIIYTVSNGNNATDQNADDCVKHKKKEIGLATVMYPSSAWKWMIDNKFSMLSISAAGLMLSAASKGISRDLRVKM